ncbi:DUF6735 family protein [Natronobiforma cellulositropha]|uniref:DUF6735 family protein n=1 Tax=Natronobiforma cellulositropha TaxID=1679076 RepID=UPI0021D5A97B|nr:DUF6735 family protein [Natronobiforma cellulositropha]
MGHRALVAYRRPDHLYDLRYSHWGADGLELADSLTRETPLARGSVDADPLAETVALERVLSDYLDPCAHEAFYLVTERFEVSAYRVLWLEWGDGREEGRGALVRVDPGPDDLAVRTWFRATKTVLGDVVEMGVLSRRAAQSYLEARVCEDEDGYVYTYGGPHGQNTAESW